MFHKTCPRNKAFTGHLSARKYNETKKSHVLKQCEFLYLRPAQIHEQRGNVRSSMTWGQYPGHFSKLLPPGFPRWKLKTKIDCFSFRLEVFDIPLRPFSNFSCMTSILVNRWERKQLNCFWLWTRIAAYCKFAWISSRRRFIWHH